MTAVHTSLSLSESVSEPVLSQDPGSATDDSGSDADQDVKDDRLSSADSGSDGDEEQGGTSRKSNPGWADAMAKILKTNKPKGKKSIVLAKAKKLSSLSQKKTVEKLGFEIDGEVKEEKPDVDATDVKPKLDKKLLHPKIKRIEWYSKGRQKPNILDKDREKTLSKIGTKGVIQLFNAVRQQQKVIDSRLLAAGSGPSKREKMLKTINKKAFLDVLTGSAVSQPVDNPVKEEADVKAEDEEAPTWKVLRQDFMMGGRFKDWDRTENQGTSEERPVEMDSDSD